MQGATGKASGSYDANEKSDSVLTKNIKGRAHLGNSIEGRRISLQTVMNLPFL
jgi:hypothetical protein